MPGDNGADQSNAVDHGGGGGSHRGEADVPTRPAARDRPGRYFRVCLALLASATGCAASNWAQLTGAQAQNAGVVSAAPWSRRWGTAVAARDGTPSGDDAAAGGATSVWVLGGDDYRQPSQHDVWAAPGGPTDPALADAGWPTAHANVNPLDPLAPPGGGGGFRNDVWVWRTTGAPGGGSWRAETSWRITGPANEPKSRVVSTAAWRRLGAEVDAAAAAGAAAPPRSGLVPPVSAILWAGGYREWLCCLGGGGWFPCRDSAACDSAGGDGSGNATTASGTGGGGGGASVSPSPSPSPTPLQRRWSPRRGHAAAGVSLPGPAADATVSTTGVNEVVVGGGGFRVVVLGGRARSLEEIPAAEAVGGLDVSYAYVAAAVPAAPGAGVSRRLSASGPAAGGVAAAATDGGHAAAARAPAPRLGGAGGGVGASSATRASCPHVRRGQAKTPAPLRPVVRRPVPPGGAARAALPSQRAAPAAVRAAVPPQSPPAVGALGWRRQLHGANDTAAANGTAVAAAVVPDAAYVYTHELSLLTSDVWASRDGSAWALVNPGCYVPQLEHSPPPGTALQQCAADADCFAKRLGDAGCVAGMCVCRHWSPRERFALATNASGALVLSGGLTYAQSGGLCGAFTCAVAYPVLAADVWVSVDGGAAWAQLTPLAPWAPRADHALVFATVPVAAADAGGAPTALALLWLLGGRGRGNATTAAAQPLLADVWVSADGGATWALNTPSAPWGPRAAFAAVANGSTLWLLAGETQYALPGPAAAPDAPTQAALAAAGVPTNPVSGAAPQPLLLVQAAAAAVARTADAVTALLPPGTGATGEVTLDDAWLVTPLSDVWTCDTTTALGNATVADAVALAAGGPAALASLLQPAVWLADVSVAGAADAPNATAAAALRAHFEPTQALTAGGAPPAATPAAIGAGALSALAAVGVVTWADLASVGPAALARLLDPTDAAAYAWAGAAGAAAADSVAHNHPCALRLLAQTLLWRCGVHHVPFPGEDVLRGLADVGGPALVAAAAPPPPTAMDAACAAALPWGPPPVAEADADVVCAQRFSPRAARPAALAVGGDVFLVGGREGRWAFAADVWYRDNRPPRTLLLGVPRDGSAEGTFTFACDEPACTFECRVSDVGDARLLRNWTACASPYDATTANAPKRLTLFQVRAIDPAGNRDLSMTPFVGGGAPGNYFAWTYVPPLPVLLIALLVAGAVLLLILAAALYRRWRKMQLLQRYLQKRAAGRLKRAKARVTGGDDEMLRGRGGKKKRGEGAAAPALPPPPAALVHGARARADATAVTTATATTTTTVRRRHGGATVAPAPTGPTARDVEAPPSPPKARAADADAGGPSWMARLWRRGKVAPEAAAPQPAPPAAPRRRGAAVAPAPAPPPAASAGPGPSTAGRQAAATRRAAADTAAVPAAPSAAGTGTGSGASAAPAAAAAPRRVGTVAPPTTTTTARQRRGDAYWGGAGRITVDRARPPPPPGVAQGFRTAAAPASGASARAASEPPAASVDGAPRSTARSQGGGGGGGAAAVGADNLGRGGRRAASVAPAVTPAAARAAAAGALPNQRGREIPRAPVLLAPRPPAGPR